MFFNPAGFIEDQQQFSGTPKELIAPIHDMLNCLGWTVNTSSHYLFEAKIPF